MTIKPPRECGQGTLINGVLSRNSGVRLSDLLQFLSQTCQTGCLSLKASRLRANLNLVRGRVINADFGKRHDEEAVAAALAISAWRFAFDPVPRNTEVRIDAPLHPLLLRCSVFADERAAVEEPAS